MTKIENKLFDFVQKHILCILVFAVTITGIVIRICGIHFQSNDYNSFLYPWCYQIEHAGIQGLGKQVGNYNIPYQILTYILTLFPFGSLISYKLLSIIFDVVLACSAAMIVNSFSNNNAKLKAVITYCLVFCSLTVVFNSAFWAQCDSIYVSFILLAIYFLKKDKNAVSFVMLGLAFAFKLQFVFILPVFLFYYVATRKISLLHFLIIPAVNCIMCLPALFFGRNVLDSFTIYLEQTDYGKLIQMNCPNIYAFMCSGSDVNNYYLFKTFSIIFTITILGIALALIIYKKVDMNDNYNFLITSIWTVFTCLMFLSSMHERYTYLLNILLIIYVILTGKKVWLAVACSLVSLRGYCFYLFGYEALDLKTTAIIYVSLYAYVTYMFAKDVILNKRENTNLPILT